MSLLDVCFKPTIISRRCQQLWLLMVFNTMYTLALSHEASRMGETTGPRLQDGVSLVPGRDSACALEAVAHRDDPRRAGAVGRVARCGGLRASSERRPEARPRTTVGKAGGACHSEGSVHCEVRLRDRLGTE